MIYLLLFLSIMATPSYYIFVPKDISSLFDESSVTLEDNYLKVSLGMRQLFSIEESTVWDIWYQDGQVVIGSERGVYYGRDKDIKRIVNTESDVFSVCIYDGSIVYSQGGKIFLVDNRGQRKNTVFTGANFIWKMLNYKKELYLFTGLPAGVMRLNGNKVDTLFLLPDKHVIDGIIKDGVIYCATDEGRIYEYNISEKKGQTLICDKEMGEIISLEIVEDTIFFISSDYFEGDENVEVKKISKENGNKDKKEKKEYYIGKMINGKVTNITKCSAAGIGVFKDKSHFYLIYAAGNVVKMFYDGVESDIGATKGESFELIKRCGDKLFAVDSPGGNVYEILPVYKGYIVSPIISAEMMGTDSIVKWGKITCDYEGNVKIYVRGGSLKEVDTTWTRWQLIKNGNITLKTPYIQWKCELSRKSKLFRIVTSCLSVDEDELNNPRIDKVEVFFPFKTLYLSEEEKNGPVSVDRNINVNISMLNSGKSGNMCYLYIKNENGRFIIDSLQVSENISFSFNSRLLNDGFYRCYVEIRDKNGTLKDSLSSSKFYVDNTPPRIVKYKQKGGNIEFMLKDEHSLIKSCYSSVNYGKFSLVYPIDSIFDEKEEVVRVKKGEHIHLIFYDEYMNMGEYIE